MRIVAAARGVTPMVRCSDPLLGIEIDVPEDWAMGQTEVFPRVFLGEIVNGYWVNLTIAPGTLPKGGLAQAVAEMTEEQ